VIMLRITGPCRHGCGREAISHVLADPRMLGDPALRSLQAPAECSACRSARARAESAARANHLTPAASAALIELALIDGGMRS
jgi:hypothetical protein